MKITIVVVILLSYLIVSFNQDDKSEINEIAIPVFQNKGHELVNRMVQKVRYYRSLVDKKDVTCRYTYATPDGKTDYKKY